MFHVYDWTTWVFTFVARALFRKSGVGEVGKMGGFRVGEVCLLVPSGAYDMIVEGLKGLALMPENSKLM